MILKLARAFADRVGFAAEWAEDKVQRYFIYLVKTLIRFAIGCVLSGLAAWYTVSAQGQSRAIGAAVAVVAMGGSFALLKFVKLPADFLINWATDKFRPIREEFFSLANIILGTVLALFYILADRLYEEPLLFLGFLGMLTVVFTVMNLPKSSFVDFFHRRAAYIIGGMVVAATIWQHVLTPNQRDRARLYGNDNPVEVQVHLNANGDIVDQNETPLQFGLVDRQGNPVPHYGRYRDENLRSHFFLMHKEEKEFPYQDRVIRYMDVADITEAKRELREMARARETTVQPNTLTAQTPPLPKPAEPAKAVAKETPKPPADKSAPAEVVTDPPPTPEPPKTVPPPTPAAPPAPKPTEAKTFVTGKWDDPKTKEAYIVAQLQEPLELPTMTLRGQDLIRYQIVSLSETKDNFNVELMPAAYISGATVQVLPPELAWSRPSLTAKKGNGRKVLSILGGAAAGAIVGAAKDGKEGALIGAGIGGAVAALVVAKYKGKEFNVPTGTEVPLRFAIK